MAEIEGADLLARLSATMAERRGASPDESYVASLFDKGEDAILRKIGEETVELLLASKSGTSSDIVAEAADVWFHVLVLLSHKGLGSEDVLNELERREGVSGHAEKAARRRS